MPEPSSPPAPPSSEVEVAVDEGPDRDRLTLEQLESNLAVLELALARVDAGDLEPGSQPAMGARPREEA